VKRRRRDLPVFAFALTLIVLVGGALLGYLNARRLIANDRSVAHTDESIVELVTVLSALQDAETAQRAYLLTEDDAYLQPYRDGTARVQTELAHLNPLIVDPTQKARLAVLQQRITLKLGELERTIALGKAGTRGAALALVRSNNSKVLMDEARAQIAAMQTAERELLNRRADESEHSWRTTIISIVLSAVIGCALLAIVFTLTRRNLLLRQRAMDELSAERERLRVTLAGIADAVLTVDRSCRIIFMNPAAEVLTGWSQPETLGKPLEAVFRTVDEQTRASVESSAQRVLRDGVIVALADQAVLIRKDGKERLIDDNAAPIVDAQGNLVGCVLVFRDITQRRREEQRRADDEARIRSVLDYTVDGILTIDEDGTIETFNTAAEKLFGYRAEEVIGRNVKLLMPEPFSTHHDTYLANYNRTGDAKIIGVGREVAGRRKDGTTLPLELAVSEFALGARRNFTGIARDITQRRRIEQQMHEMMSELQKSDRRKDEFLAMLAHELRGPLAPLRNGLQLLKRTDINPEQFRQMRDAMERQLGQLVRLVNDLIDASRITRNKIDLRTGPVDLAAVIQQSIETCQPIADAARHQVSATLPPMPIYVKADPARLTQVFSNILHNACKYTEPGGRIAITAQLAGDEAIVQIKDTGFGIPSSKLTSIFEMFTQVDRTLERSQGGLGIGLSLVKRLVEMHGGSVEAFSDGPGHGSEFVIRLPVSNESPAVETVQAGVEPEMPSRRILIVDDNTDSATSLAMLLQASRQEAYTVHDGLEAVAAAERLQPDVILLDIGLPKLNGYEVCRRVRQQSWAKKIMIVAVTGWGQIEDQHKSKEAGFDAHMVKPADFAALMQLFSSHLSGTAETAPGSGLT
jgi:PAS domain S-box-containing protein